MHNFAYWTWDAQSCTELQPINSCPRIPVSTSISKSNPPLHFPSPPLHHTSNRIVLLLHFPSPLHRTSNRNCTTTACNFHHRTSNRNHMAIDIGDHHYTALLPRISNCMAIDIRQRQRHCVTWNLWTEQSIVIPSYQTFDPPMQCNARLHVPTSAISCTVLFPTINNISQRQRR